MSQSLLDKVASASHALEHEYTPEQVAVALGAIDSLAKSLKEAKAMFESAITPHLKANGAIEIGTTLITLGVERKVKCVNREAALSAVFDAAQGDMGDACHFFASEPFKQGSLKQVMPPEAWAECFEITYSDDVKIKTLDTRFIK